jgi:hypothetical protein
VSFGRGISVVDRTGRPTGSGGTQAGRGFLVCVDVDSSRGFQQARVAHVEQTEASATLQTGRRRRCVRRKLPHPQNFEPRSVTRGAGRPNAGTVFAVPVNNGAVPRKHRSHAWRSRRTSHAVYARTSDGASTAGAGGSGRLQVRCGPSRRVRRPPRRWSARTGRPRGRGHRQCARPHMAAGIPRVRR